jgi:hypothetical protein
MAGLNLRPPDVRIGPELAWLTRRAFGDPRPEHVRGLNGAKAEHLSRAFRLGARIAARSGLAALELELGVEHAARLRDEHLATAAQQILLERTMHFVLEQGRSEGVPVILLKFAALHSRSVLLPGSRPAADVDVLVPARFGEHLQRRLLAAGCELTGGSGHAHQLPPLVSPDGIPIEVHRHLPGLRERLGRRFITADDLLAMGLVEQFGSALVPVVALLVAHLVAHGFVQNAPAPAAYPLLQTLADLSDLSRGDQAVIMSAARLLEPEVGAQELASIAGLVRDLSRGTGLDHLGENPVFCHVLASVLDPAYGRALKLRALTRPLTERPFPQGHWRAMVTALFPGDAELDAIYGDHGLRRKALRPLDLAWRTLRALGALTQR